MTERKKIAIVGTVGVPARYGGFETLAEYLLDTGKIGTVYCSARSYEIKRAVYKGARLVYIPLNANGVQSIFYDGLALLHATLTGEKNILLLGVSGAIFVPIVKLISRRARIVTNIDGLEWKRQKWGAVSKAFLKFSEKIAVKYSDIVIADNQAIVEYVRSEYGKESTLITYGGDHAVAGLQCAEEPEDYALALCRIEPENKVHIILEAFGKTKKKLMFVGNWGNSSYGRELMKRYSGCDNIQILNAIYDQEALFKIREKCSVYIHGHSAGGTNPALVEMMHFGKPIIAFDCQYNRESTEGMAKYFHDEESLRKVLDEDKALREVAIKMVDIARRRYTWSLIGKQYSELF
ncbi:MAG: DUF1972 domain-containing protein [Steroidobacter sp.]